MLDQVRHALAVSSAKGGVGKSTLSVNLALSLARSGARVGLLDADIYGPSLPLLLGVRQAPEITPDERLVPVQEHGLALMSIGFLAGEDHPVVWRGPLLAQALQHFLVKVEWGELDYLLIDLPPGTGDIPLTLSQAVALSGAVVVTSPQGAALEDVARGIAMFDKVEIDVIGLVENMSYYLCPHCDKRHELFGRGGGQALAAKLDIEFLGEIPLLPAVREGGDRGRSVVLQDPKGPEAKIFSELAAKVAAALGGLPGAG